MNPFCYDTRHLLLPFRYKTRRDPFVSRLRSIPNERWAVLCSVLLQVSKKWLPLQCGGSFNPPPMRRNASVQRPSSKLPGLLFSAFHHTSGATCTYLRAYVCVLSEFIGANQSNRKVSERRNDPASSAGYTYMLNRLYVPVRQIIKTIYTNPLKYAYKSFKQVI